MCNVIKAMHSKNKNMTIKKIVSQFVLNHPGFYLQTIATILLVIVILGIVQMRWIYEIENDCIKGLIKWGHIKDTKKKAPIKIRNLCHMELISSYSSVHHSADIPCKKSTKGSGMAAINRYRI